MFEFGLNGLWLVGSLATVYLVGVFTSQYVKDKINGVPASLRSALSVTESAALKELSSARDRLVADTANLLAKGRAAASAEVSTLEGKPVSVAPVATPPATAAASAPAPAPALAPAPVVVAAPVAAPKS